MRIGKILRLRADTTSLDLVQKDEACALARGHLCLRRPHRTTALLLAASLALSSSLPAVRAQPVGLPSMGSASSYDLSPALEALLGRAIMAQGLHDPSYINDADVTQYLNTMGARLAANAPEHQQHIRVFGVRDAQINAFALPGGYVGINSGLVVESQSESELASVVAHEIGHVVQRHIARGMTQRGQSGNIMMVSIVGALLAALAGSSDLAMGVAAFGQASAIDQQLGFSRQAEHEADRVGFDMLSRAGYDPRGMVRMFTRLMSRSRLNEGLLRVYHSTHPPSLQRLSDIENRVARAAPVNHQDSDDFWYVRAKLRVLQAHDSQAQRRVVETLQQETRQTHGTAQAAAWYGLAVAALQRGDVDEAAKAWRQGLQVKGQSPYLAQIGIALAQRGGLGATANSPAASGANTPLQLADAAWQRWPDHMSIAFARAQALRDAGQHAQAITFLQDCIQRWPDEPRFHEWQAQSYERSNHPVDARRAMARYYENTGALPAAVEQLRQARTMSSDFYVQSEIDTRIRMLRQRLETERELLKRFE